MVIDEIRDMAIQMNAPQLEAVRPAPRPRESAEASSAAAADTLNGSKTGLTRESLEEAIHQMNQAVSILNHRLNFSVDETTGRLMVKIIDSETNEIIREVPPERVMEFVRRFQEFMGLLFDEQA